MAVVCSVMMDCLLMLRITIQQMSMRYIQIVPIAICRFHSKKWKCIFRYDCWPVLFSLHSFTPSFVWKATTNREKNMENQSNCKQFVGQISRSFLYELHTNSLLPKNGFSKIYYFSSIDILYGLLYSNDGIRQSRSHLCVCVCIGSFPFVLIQQIQWQ